VVMGSPNESNGPNDVSRGSSTVPDTAVIAFDLPASAAGTSVIALEVPGTLVLEILAREN
jgi:hypothetical protein